jgi:hypothetical protein
MLIITKSLENVIKEKEKGRQKEERREEKRKEIREKEMGEMVGDQTAKQPGKPLKRGEKKITSSGTVGLQA